MHQYTIPAYKVMLVRDGSVTTPSKNVGQSQDAVTVFRNFLGDVDREHFMVMMLDKKHKIIGVNIVSIGSLDSAVVVPREVFKPAIVSNSAAIILGHNHPSGVPDPSLQDNQLTARLVAAGDLLGITVLDHLVLGDGTTTYYSYADQGTLHPYE